MDESDSLGVGVGVVLGVGVGVGDGVVGVGVGVGVGLDGVGDGVGVWVDDLAGLGLGEAVPDFDGFAWPAVCPDPLGLTAGVCPVRAWRSSAPPWWPLRTCPDGGGLAAGPAWPTAPPEPAR